MYRILQHSHRLKAPRSWWGPRCFCWEPVGCEAVEQPTTGCPPRPLPALAAGSQLQKWPRGRAGYCGKRQQETTEWKATLFLQFSRAVTNTHGFREEYKPGNRVALLRCEAASTWLLWNGDYTDTDVFSLPLRVQTCRSPTHLPQTEQPPREQGRETTWVSSWPNAQNK